MCSKSCPGDLVIKGFDAAKEIRDQGITVISGFHSSMEKDIFDILLRGSQPIVLCLAKSIVTYRIPKNLRPRVESGQLTMIAPDFSIAEKRITKNTSDMCNKLVMDICDQILIIHAHEGGNLFRLITSNKDFYRKMYVLESNNNQYLHDIGIENWK